MGRLNNAWKALVAKETELPPPPEIERAESIMNVLAAFRGFYRWFRRGREQEFPILEFPRVKLGTRERRRAMDLLERAVAIEMIAPEDRGVFLALKMGIRPGEARALRIADYDFATGIVSIRSALKSQGSGAPRGETKTGEPGDYPVSVELRDWIAEHVPTERHFQADAPLFANPRTGNPHSAHKLREVWMEACETAEVDYVPLYRAMKHTTLTALREAGVSRDEVQAMARHRDPRTTDVYDLDDDQRRKRALLRVEDLEQRGRQTGDRGKRVTPLRKPPDSLKSRSENWRPGRESNPRPAA
jgi:integrase